MDLSFGIFVVPFIALTLIITLFIHFLKKVADKRNYKYFIVSTAIVAFVLNFGWEVVQGPLYENFEYDFEHVSFCALASIADMLMVLVLLFLFGLIYNNVYWIKRLKFTRTLTLILTGFLGAILAELWHTWRGDWSYADTMPMLPLVEVGISPVLQFSVLPLIIFVISRRALKL
ncbi:hypothetical protein GCM10009122_32170 [Fulvivirga kasyanovii]|uniref:Lycopene cyclase domain-containing protein n=1 Tax=Fulvivirga kasyanovii TaxID=396812 RepID=A0ABW9RWY4_9BACT|nr:hypothetical protein [Fulvivirga kasyanovii]MTI28386.1 hypothetical protein [Fulvivirga kasyanovii]